MEAVADTKVTAANNIGSSNNNSTHHTPNNIASGTTTTAATINDDDMRVFHVALKKQGRSKHRRIARNDSENSGREGTHTPLGRSR